MKLSDPEPLPHGFLAVSADVTDHLQKVVSAGEEPNAFFASELVLVVACTYWLKRKVIGLLEDGIIALRSCEVSRLVHIDNRIGGDMPGPRRAVGIRRPSNPSTLGGSLPSRRSLVGSPKSRGLTILPPFPTVLCR